METSTRRLSTGASGARARAFFVALGWGLLATGASAQVHVTAGPAGLALCKCEQAGKPCACGLWTIDWRRPGQATPGGNRVEVANAGARLILAPDWKPITWTEEERKKGQAWGLKTIESFHTHGTPVVAHNKRFT